MKNPGAKGWGRLAYDLPAGFQVAQRHAGREPFGELWSIMRFLNPSYLGSRRDFRRRFALPIEHEGR